MSFTTENIRNFAVAGHVGTGKTSLVENILFTGGAIGKPERVDSGKTVSDYTEEEIERSISIHTSLSNIEWHDKKINILDTPGSSDFAGEVVSALRSSESCLVAVDATSGVQIETIKIWRRLDAREMPRIVFINKMDKERANFAEAFNDLKEKFDKTFVPVTIPYGDAADFKGVVNLIENTYYPIPEKIQKEKGTEIPAEMSDLVEEYRLTLIESAAEGDDKLLEKYFEEETLTPDEIREGLTKGLKSNRLVPVFCGAAELCSGIASVLNFVANAAPNPAGKVEKAADAEGNEIEVPIKAEDPLSTLVFKTSIDQFSGKLSFVKVISGSLTPDSDLFNPREDKKERISKLYTALGKKLVEISGLESGDIGILAKVGAVETNDSLCASDRVLKFNPLKLPHPVHSISVSAVSKKDEDKLNQAMQKAAAEDLTFQVEYNTETKETVISGMGELHINMILDRIKENQKVEIETKVPQVAYRETINKPSDAEYTHKKQSGGHGQFGRVVIKIRPLERGEYYAFANEIKGGSVSKGYLPGVEKGLHEAMAEGILAGYPVVDVGISLVDGKEHPVDSSEMSFKLAAKGALKAAMQKAAPVLLEPVMILRVFADEEYLGDVLSDLSSRRGRVMGQAPIGGGIMEVDAQVPQAELLRYAIDLKSITSGTASFEMQFDHYEPISGKIADAVIQAAEQARANEE